MQEYVSLTTGHMEFLVRALDGDLGGLRPPPLPPLRSDIDPALVREAVAFLRRSNLPIEPRKQWPPGGMPQAGLSGRIAEGYRAQPGRALCVWGDAGWGSLVRQGKYRDGRFATELVDACVRMVHEWAPEPRPEWVTCIPSLRRPNLVPDFAKRLAEALGLPFHDTLEKTDGRTEQKSMANSSHQARNVDGSLSIRRPMPTGPVLLVDDIVDSRWTMTVAASLLRSRGSGEVVPLALAVAGGAT